MELRHLRYFVAVAEEASFTRAAKRLGIAQPPLSQQIKQLEESLGATLLHRAKRGLTLTDAGRIFLNRARGILRSTQEAEVATRRVHDGEDGHLTVGYMDYTSYTFLPPIIRAFRDSAPTVGLSLRHLYNTQSIAALLNETVDVSFLRSMGRQDEIAYKKIAAEPFVVALPETHRLAKKVRVSVASLKDDAFIVCPRQLDARYFDSIVSFCGSAGFTPNIVQEALQIHAAIGLVSAGLGVAVVPSSVQRMKLEGAVCRPFVERTPPVDLFVAWRKVHESATLESFLSTVQRVTSRKRFK